MKNIALEYRILEYKIILNNELYERKIISFEEKSKMENILINRLSKYKKGDINEYN